MYGNDHRGHGRTAAQQYVLDHSREIDGLARLASAAPPGENLLNAPFEPARTPFDPASLGKGFAETYRSICSRAAMIPWASNSMA